jgi:16S rRNA (uracil1498-N3)-methyltransferase
MSTPRLFVPIDKLRGTQATLDAAAHRHLVKVLRLSPGCPLRVFDGAGTEIDACIEAVGKASVEISLGERRRIPAPACTIALLVAPPRGERMDLVVQKTTELGVARIVPVATERGVAQPGQHQQRRWRTIAEEAARQSGRADVPEIAPPVPLDQALASAALAPRRLLLWEGEHGQSLPQTLADGPRAVALLVGPEGGFAPLEVGQATAAGFDSVGLGPRILRSETAAIVAVALAQAAAGGLGFGQ